MADSETSNDSSNCSHGTNFEPTIEIILGTISKKPQFIHKRNKLSRPFLVVKLQNVCYPGYDLDDYRNKLRLYFVNEAAKSLHKITLCERDNIAIHKPILFYSSKYVDNVSIERIAIYIGIHQGNSINQCFLKTCIGEHWRRFEELLAFSENDSENSFDDEVITTRSLSRNHSKSRSRNSTRRSPSINTTSNSSTSESMEKRKSSGQQSSVLCYESDEDEEPVLSRRDSFEDRDRIRSRRESVDKIQKTFPSKSKTPTKELTNQTKNNLMESSSGKQRRITERTRSLEDLVEAGPSTSRVLPNKLLIQHIRPLNVANIKLVDACRDGALFICCGIITNVEEKLPTVDERRRRIHISIRDETITEDFSVIIYFQNDENKPILRKYDIIWLNHMKVTLKKSVFRGYVSDARTVATFSRELSEVLYMNDSRFLFTDDHKARIEELRKWMFENIPDSRIFTPLANIEFENKNIDLSGYLVSKKVLARKSTVLLRFQDQTRISIPFARYDFNSEDWNPTKFEIVKTKSYSIDICASNLSEKSMKLLDKLYENCPLEIRNVIVMLHKQPCKGVAQNFVKFLLKDPETDLKIIADSDETDYECSDVEMIEEESQNIIEIPSQSTQGKKRKLYNNDDSNIYAIESVGSNVVEKHKKEKKKKPVVVRPNSFLDSSDDERNTELDDRTTRSDSVIVENSNQRSINSAPTNAENPNVLNAREKHVFTDNNDILSNNVHNSTRGENNDTELSIIPCSQNVGYILKRWCNETTPQGKDQRKQDLFNLSYITRWPEITNEVFLIKVHITLTLPRIDENSGDTEVVSLIHGYCRECDKYVPLYYTKWKDFVAYCNKCVLNKTGVINALEFMLFCQFILRDSDKIQKAAYISGTNAEKFFGCTVMELASSEDVRVKMKQFFPSIIDEPLVLKLRTKQRSKNKTNPDIIQYEIIQ